MRQSCECESLRPIAIGLAALLALASCDADKNGPNIDHAAGAPKEYVEREYVVPDQATVAASVQSAQADDSSWQIKLPFYAAGREPFWRLDLQEGWFVFERLGLPQIEAPVVQPERVDASDVFRSDALELTLTPGECASAPEGEAPVAEAQVSFDGVFYSGCVYAGESAAAAAPASGESWVAETPGRIVEIDACLGRLAEQDGVQASDGDVPGVILAIYPRDAKVAAVVMKTRAGRMFECGSDADGNVTFMDPLDPAHAGDWNDAQVQFLRASSDEPPADCLEAEAVVADDGVIGYALPRNCRY